MTESLPPPDEIDPGRPIAEIAALAESPGGEFLERIRRAIQRRMAASGFLDFALPALLNFLKEIGQILFTRPAKPRRPPGGPDDE